MEYLEKLNRISHSFGNPFLENCWPKPFTIKEIIDTFQEGKAVSLAARVVSKREHGKSGFSHLMDYTGKVQIYCQQDALGKQFEVFKELELGDIVGVAGKLFTTRTGELTVQVTELKLLAKALRPLPEKWHGLRDIEVRYRRRYLDLIANPEVKDVFLKRSKTVSLIREFFSGRGFVEVETPMLHHIAGGAAGRQFKTHHNATACDVYLRIAPELHLKRLLVGGLDKNFEINRSFRNEGTSTRHNPEFTMLEAYCAYENYEYMLKLCEDLISQLATAICGTLLIEYQGKRIDFTPPWPRISFAGLFEKEFGVVPSDSQEAVFAKVGKKLNLSQGLSRTQMLNIIEELIESHFPVAKPV